MTKPGEPDTNRNGPEEHVLTRFDIIDRYERSIDKQIEFLDGVDDKAEHATRLIGILLGLIFTGAPFLLRELGDDLTFNPPVEIAFSIGIIFLSGSFILGVVTYLSSKLRLGLHPSTADTLTDLDLDLDEYSEMLMNAYAFSIEDNKEVLDKNAFRFRLTLTSMLGGFTFISTSLLLYILDLTKAQEWGVLVLLSYIGLCIVLYVLTGNYLTLRTRD